MKRHEVVRTSVACLVATALAVSPMAEPAMTDAELRIHVESFDYVWTTVRDKHFDPELGGVDWTAVRDELRPTLAAATSIDDVRATLEDLLSRLELSHFGIVPAEVYADLEGEDGEGVSRRATAGLDVRVVDGRALVTAVTPGLPAAAAGVEPGWEVVRVGEDDVAPRLARLGEEFADKSWQSYILAASVLGRFRGPAGKTVTAVFRDGENQEEELSFELVDDGAPQWWIGHLPPVKVRAEAELVDGSIGYVSFNFFMDPLQVMPVFNGAMERFMDADAVILDVRGNGGGIPEMAMGMIGWLVDERCHVGTLQLRAGELKLLAYPRPETFPGPVVVLVDDFSGSAAELFAGGLQDLGRATVVGTTTAGAVLGSVFEKLPNGDRFQYAAINLTLARSGVSLEGRGVVPDVEAGPERQALLQGRDPALEAAIRWIREQKPGSSDIGITANNKEKLQ